MMFSVFHSKLKAAKKSTKKSTKPSPPKTILKIMVDKYIVNNILYRNIGNNAMNVLLLLMCYRIGQEILYQYITG